MKEYDTIKKVSFEIRKDIFDMFARKNGTEAAASEKKKEAPKYTWQQNVTLYLHDIVYMLVVVMLVLVCVGDFRGRGVCGGRLVGDAVVGLCREGEEQAKEE